MISVESLSSPFRGILGTFGGAKGHRGGEHGASSGGAEGAENVVGGAPRWATALPGQPMNSINIFLKNANIF